jgi:FK506-binding protein 4/5
LFHHFNLLLDYINLIIMSSEHVVLEQETGLTQEQEVEESYDLMDAVDVTPDLTETGEKNKVLKQIAVVGDSEGGKPQVGDTVTVHYTGRLESTGEVFDSSRKPGRDPFVFELGKGSVIKGWDVGVATMCKGERARFTIDSSYGYGASGAPPSIPPNARLVFDVELLGWKDGADISDDGMGGVLKYTEVEGSGWATPGWKDDVVVSCVVWGDDGEVIYETGDGKYDTYTLSERVESERGVVGFVGLQECRGLSMALKKMKLGEVAMVHVRAPYISNSDELMDGMVKIKVTLKDWYKVDHITSDDVISVTKKSLVSVTEGLDWHTPNAGSTVRVSYEARLDDGTVLEKVEGVEFVTDDEQALVPKGLELAVMKMREKEQAIVRILPGEYLCIGESTEPLAGDQAVTFDITLVEMTRAKESWDLDEVEKVEMAKAVKSKGNDAFKAGKVSRALTLWERSKSYVEYNDNFKEHKDEAKALLKSLQLNTAAAYLKAGEPLKAREAATKVLEGGDPYNEKALYRRAQSYIDTSDWVEAGLDIKLALGNNPDNVDFKNLSKKLRIAENKSAAKEKSMWAKTFQKFSEGQEPKPSEPSHVSEQKTGHEQ